MIAWLSGVLRFQDAGAVIVDVGGVGYAVTIPVGVLGQTAIGEPVELHIHTHVREDQISLFGFESPMQLQTFGVLTDVKGVGPKLAVTLLGGIDPAGLAAAIDQGDLARLTSLKGVGKRLADRLCTELKGKLEFVGTPAAGTAGGSRPTSDAFRDLQSALRNLGFRPKEIESVVGRLAEEQPDADLDALVVAALGYLRKQGS